ncbi:reverse transcriptase domain-containing protein [Tanacetum coccineum]
MAERADPHKYIAEFIKICEMFRYTNTNADSIKLKLFPSSLSEEAKFWYNELSLGVITTWEEMRRAFVSRFFPPVMFDRLMGEIRDIKAKPIRKTVSFAEGTNYSKLVKKIEALTIKIDSQFKEIKREMKEMRDGCSKCGGLHPSSECDDKPMGEPKEEANYVYGGYRGGGYKGNYYGRNFGNWRDRQPRDDNRTSQPCDDHSNPPSTPEKKPEESNSKKP